MFRDVQFDVTAKMNEDCVINKLMHLEYLINDLRFPFSKMRREVHGEIASCDAGDMRVVVNIDREGVLDSLVATRKQLARALAYSEELVKQMMPGKAEALPETD